MYECRYWFCRVDRLAYISWNDCDGDRPCGGKMETWETGYETEAVCCATMPYKETYEQCTYKLIEPQPSTPAPTPQPDTSWYPGTRSLAA